MIGKKLLIIAGIAAACGFGSVQTQAYYHGYNKWHGGYDRGHGYRYDRYRYGRYGRYGQHCWVRPVCRTECGYRGCFKKCFRQRVCN